MGKLVPKNPVLFGCATLFGGADTVPNNTQPPTPPVISIADVSLVERASRRDIHGTPQRGSNIIDSVGVRLLTDWINALPGCP